MSKSRGCAEGILYALIAGLLVVSAVAVAPAEVRAEGGTDSLTVVQPEGLEVWSVYLPSRNSFRVFLTWEDIPDSCATFIHPPDTLGWGAGTPDSLLSQPVSGGTYNGSIDRTVGFRARTGGIVGQDSIVFEYAVRREEHFNGLITIDDTYVPGTAIPVTFRDERPPPLGAPRDFGLTIAFGPGFVDQNGLLAIGMEDTEGFHLWRGIEPDGSDLEVIGELSKEEAFRGNQSGGSIVDSVYFEMIIPSLRANDIWFSPFGPVDCLGDAIRIDLASNGLFWFDCNAFNGFTYYYTVTAFDRSYSVRSGRQGLQKIDNCTPVLGEPYACRDQLVPLTIEVDTQDVLRDIYAVPNPFRSGGTRLTRENYHNFPDDFVRFVNVPQRSTIRIYTVAGDLVWEKVHLGTGGNIEWDTRNFDGNEVSSGVYIYKVESEGDHMFGRLVVIR